MEIAARPKAWAAFVLPTIGVIAFAYPSLGLSAAVVAVVLWLFALRRILSKSPPESGEAAAVALSMLLILMGVDGAVFFLAGESKPNVINSASVFEAAAGLFLIASQAWLLGGNWRLRTRSTLSIKEQILLVLGVFCGLKIVFAVMQLLLIGQLLPSLYEFRGVGERVVSTFMLVAMVPLLEEVMFRGYLYKALRVSMGPIASVTLTSLLFAGYHGTAVGLLTFFMVGLCAGYLRERTGSLAAPIALHAAYNLSVLIP